MLNKIIVKVKKVKNKSSNNSSQWGEGIVYQWRAPTRFNERGPRLSNVFHGTTDVYKEE